MKKHWYDYLWILSSLYLILGFFNILFAWLGLFCFFIPLIIAAVRGTKGYCNRYCGRGQLFGLLGGRFGLSRKKRHPEMDEIEGIPVWISDLLFCHVFRDAVEYISGIRRSRGAEAGCHPPVDVQAAVALGISRNAVPSRRGTVCVRLLQCDADLYRSRTDYHDAVQAPQLVCVLPDGDHDPADLQSAERESVNLHKTTAKCPPCALHRRTLFILHIMLPASPHR